MTGWEVPWHCEICDCEFKPGSGGGSCGRCGQAICKKHLGVITIISQDHADTEEIVCEACLTTGEQTRPVRQKYYHRWFKKHNPSHPENL